MPTALTITGVAPSGAEHLNLISIPSFPVLKAGEVLLKTLAAPINPIDLRAGYDGILEVVESVDPAFAPGDVRALLIFNAFRAQIRAILKMGACVAWAILEDTVSGLRPGDWIIQNGATSVVAQLVIQMARLRGFKTISVIRDRSADDFTEKKRKLEALGGDIVVSEGELERGEVADVLTGKNIALALDCVFGESGQRMAELLSPGGTFVAFGQLSGANSTITLTMNLVFFKNLTFRPFRLSKALAARSDEEMDQMLEKIIGMFNSGQIKVPELDVVHWNDGKPAELSQKLRGAVEQAQSAMIGKTKTIFGVRGTRTFCAPMDQDLNGLKPDGKIHLYHHCYALYQDSANKYKSNNMDTTYTEADTFPRYMRYSNPGDVEEAQ
ncbi:NAD(P)-binding protein [Rickenella mellea]|uniref:enoyl-[acyl-carrier-protein] reductase n=1 Tax=Rickenella mellea TaxID=50990 RepID=A0A4Y7QGC5_9AGAM|nr:NAD(P)-binding protein [Rickenella mellea]